MVHQLDLMTDMLGTPSAEAIGRVSVSFFHTASFVFFSSWLSLRGLNVAGR